MKKITAFLIFFSFLSCGTYTMTSFYVKNTSDKNVSFDASVLKFSQNGPYDVNQNFIIKPKDSVLARKVSMKKDVSPEKWFTQFNIFPTDSLEFNDPKDPQNWLKSYSNDGQLIYVFNIVK